jgi:hypothetical protein
MMQRNNVSMLAPLFSVAPMMDWSGPSQKAKLNQQLSIVRK